MKLIIGAVLLLLTAYAYADPHPHEETNDGNGVVDTSAVVDILNSSESTSSAGAEGGDGGAGGLGGLGGIGEGGSSGGNVFKSDSAFFALSTTAPNIDGCITGKGVGLGGDGGGGLVQWAGLNIPCFLNEMAEAERHVDTRARLKCAAKPFRNAIAYEHPKKERQAQCISYVTAVWKREITYLKELVATNGGDAGGTETPPDPK